MAIALFNHFFDVQHHRFDVGAAVHIGLKRCHRLRIAAVVFVVAAQRVQHRKFGRLRRINNRTQIVQQIAVETVVVGQIVRVVASFGDTHQKLIAETLVGNPCRTIVRFGKGFDHRFLVHIVGSSLRRGGRQHHRHRHRGEIGHGIHAIERNQILPLLQAWCGVAAVTIDAKIAVARRFANHQHNGLRLLLFVGLYAKRKVVELFGGGIDFSVQIHYLDGVVQQIERQQMHNASVRLFVVDWHEKIAVVVRSAQHAQHQQNTQQFARRHRKATGARKQRRIVYLVENQPKIARKKRYCQHYCRPRRGAEFEKFARFGNENGIDKQQRGGGVVHDEMHAFDKPQKQCEAVKNKESTRF